MPPGGTTPAVRVALRVDATPAIGTGHLARCGVLARALAAAGAEVHLVTRPPPDELAAQIAGWGLAHHLLDAAEERDAEATVELLAPLGQLDWLIVDHYGLGRAWEEAVRPCAARLMVIDDLANRPHGCDLLLDTAYPPDSTGRYAGLVPEGCRLLFGPRYALLRPEYARARKARGARDRVARLLVCFGGSDLGDETGRALAALAPLVARGLTIDLVVGAANPHRAALRARVAGLAGVTLHEAPAHLAELLLAADLAVGAGGTMTWERACVGVPSVVVSIAANQEPGAAALAAAGAHLYLGPAGAVTGEQLAGAVTLLSENAPLRRHLGETAAALVDGRGVERVVRDLLQPTVLLRRARADDCERVWEWRNAAEVRRYSLDEREIPLEQHRRWYAGALADPTRLLLIGEVGGEPVGVLRYDLDGAEAEVSVYLVPGRLNRGLGAPLLVAGTAYLRSEGVPVHTVRARIRPENAASRAVFERAGYRLDHAIYHLRLGGGAGGR